MKNSNQWLSTITILIAVIIMTDASLALLKHPVNTHTNMQTTIIVCSAVLVAVIVWNLYHGEKKQKK